MKPSEVRRIAKRLEKMQDKMIYLLHRIRDEYPDGPEIAEDLERNQGIFAGTDIANIVEEFLPRRRGAADNDD